MGSARRRPERLAEKLKKIRNTLGLSQTELHKSLGVEEDIPYTRISDYELGKNEP
jgi:predicted transcriptional regulator